MSLNGLNRHSTAPSATRRDRTLRSPAVMKMIGMCFCRLFQFSLQVRARHSRHGDVENQTASFIEEIGCEERLGRRESLRGKAELPHQVGERLADRLVVIDDRDKGIAPPSTSTYRYCCSVMPVRVANRDLEPTQLSCCILNTMASLVGYRVHRIAHCTSRWREGSLWSAALLKIEFGPSLFRKSYTKVAAITLYQHRSRHSDAAPIVPPRATVMGRQFKVDWECFLQLKLIQPVLSRMPCLVRPRTVR